MLFWLYVYVYVCLYMYVYFFFGEGYEYWDLGSVTAKFFPLYGRYLAIRDVWTSSFQDWLSPVPSCFWVANRLEVTRHGRHSNSRHSNSFHIDAVVLESHVNRSFCIKHVDKESTEAKPWPKGNDFFRHFQFFQLSLLS